MFVLESIDTFENKDPYDQDNDQCAFAREAKAQGVIVDMAISNGKLYLLVKEESLNDAEKQMEVAFTYDAHAAPHNFF